MTTKPHFLLLFRFIKQSLALPVCSYFREGPLRVNLDFLDFRDLFHFVVRKFPVFSSITSCLTAFNYNNPQRTVQMHSTPTE